MHCKLTAILIFLSCLVGGVQSPSDVTAQEPSSAVKQTLEEVRVEGALRSRYRNTTPVAKSFVKPQANLKAYHKDIQPILKQACYDCHSGDTAEGDLRIDTLDPDLLNGDDISWWLELSAAVTNGEMPPEDGPELTDKDRNKIIQWLATETQSASKVRRNRGGHSSFRRMTRYEYNYALQDLLGLPLNFAKDLPPDPVSADGFKNSSDVLHLTAKQYSDYLELNRDALKRATVRGTRPEQLHWCITAERAATRRVKTRQELDRALGIIETDKAEDSAKKKAKGKASSKKGKKNQRQNGQKKIRSAHYLNTKTGNTSPAKWAFRRAVHAWSPSSTLSEAPNSSDYVVVLPTGQRFVVELGNRLPDKGTLRVRVRAWRVPTDNQEIPSVALEFGWQGSNNSKASVKISSRDILIDATPDDPQFYQWDIPLSEIYPRNPVRKTIELGARKLTNPSEYIRLHNTSLQKSAAIQFDYIEVSAPVYEQWPPVSHQGIFIESKNANDEDTYAREIISRFMTRAWRRSVTDAEVDGKMKYFKSIRPVCQDFQQAVVEVLATVLSSPRFLYLVQDDKPDQKNQRQLNEFELATRLSMFLWCSIPDQELLDLASQGRLSEPEELARQTKRLLADPRHSRFSKHFVKQWLNMSLLDFLTIDKSAYPQFNDLIKVSMQQEPIAFFEDVLKNDSSVMDFIHADYALLNDRLAQHYGIKGVHGSQFRKVTLDPNDHRGGILTQAGLLAMNSDGTDSHPLKRGVWLLKSILNDPPPPPPPAVPEIDLTDPKILKMTLKQRIEDHRNNAACMSCHVKIDPWGIAFENFDAVGRWRTKIKGRKIDPSSLLYNQHELNGMSGLKRYLLAERQDQFARAMVYKLSIFALGRPMTFADRADLEKITANLRQNGDGLQTLILELVKSKLFTSN